MAGGQVGPGLGLEVYGSGGVTVAFFFRGGIDMTISVLDTNLWAFAELKLTEWPLNICGGVRREQWPIQATISAWFQIRLLIFWSSKFSWEVYSFTIPSDAKKIDDIGVIMLRVDQYDRAQHVLNDAGWKPITEDALLVRVKDEPGAIAHLAKRFRDADLHVSSMRIVQHHGDWGAISVCAEPIENARELVKDQLLADTASD